MTVLSEVTIRTYLRAGQIVANGDERHVSGLAYSCHAAKVFPGGAGEPGETHSTLIDWTDPRNVSVYRIQPRQLVWVRMRETVRLPPDICAFWWQTNSLSRKGLMLVNMSMVNPGYEGSLACLFVNFGRQPVYLDPGMTVARLVFHRLDEANQTGGEREEIDEYDRKLRDVALNGPSSFLSFQEFSTTFQEEKERAFREFKESADSYVLELNTRLDEMFKDKTDNLPKFLLKSYGIAAGGFALLVLALAVSPWIRDRFALDVQKQIESVVDAELGKRVSPISTLDPSSTHGIERRVQELEKRTLQSGNSR